ncbi:MAG: hypothetical protein WD037_14270 [Balneolales bacterium]
MLIMFRLSHLPVKEFSCEAFIHKGKIRFLNITEYIHLGYSNYVPVKPMLQAKRPQILNAMQKLVDSFGIEYGIIYPEWFLTEDDTISFGEVAARIPGGHIFELIENANGFDPIQTFVMCSDPSKPEEVIQDFFPPDDAEPHIYAGSLMIYPRPDQGWNPTCQSARGISLWSRHAPGKHQRMPHRFRQRKSKRLKKLLKQLGHLL